MDVLEDDWDRLVTFYDFPDEHWRHLRKLLTVAEKRFRKLNAPHLLRQVAEGKIFKDGKPVPTAHGRAAA